MTETNPADQDPVVNTPKEDPSEATIVESDVSLTLDPVPDTTTTQASISEDNIETNSIDDAVRTVIEERRYDPNITSLAARDAEAIASIFEHFNNSIGDAFVEQVGIPGSHPNVFLQEEQMLSAEAMRAQAAIEALKKNHGAKLMYAPTLVIDGKPVLGVREKPYVVNQDTTLTNIDSLNALDGNSKSYPCYNSGFCIEVAPPDPVDVGAFYTKANASASQYGRMLGGLFYLYQDFLIKQVFVETFLKCIRKATFADWNVRDTLLNVMKFSDFDVFVMAVAHQMYPNKYDNFRFSCDNVEAKCNNTKVESIDISKFIRSDFTEFHNNREAVQFMIEQATKSTDVKGLLTYQDLIKVNGKDRENDENVINFVSPNGTQINLYLTHPSIQRWFNNGSEMISDMQASFDLDDARVLIEATTYFAYYSYAPWVSKIELKHPGSSGYITTDSPALMGKAMLKIHKFDPEAKIIDSIENYINRTKVTIMGYPIKPCVKCGKVPESKTGYYTVDPIQSFFMMAAQYLGS